MCFVKPKDWDLNLIYKNELKILILIFVLFSWSLLLFGRNM